MKYRTIRLNINRLGNINNFEQNSLREALKKYCRKDGTGYVSTKDNINEDIENLKMGSEGIIGNLAKVDDDLETGDFTIRLYDNKQTDQKLLKNLLKDNAKRRYYIYMAIVGDELPDGKFKVNYIIGLYLREVPRFPFNHIVG